MIYFIFKVTFNQNKEGTCLLYTSFNKMLSLFSVQKHILHLMINQSGMNKMCIRDRIQSWLKSKSKEELKTIWKCNDKITEKNFNRLENMDLYHLLTPAVLSYEGIAFQYMAPSVFEDSQFEYVQNHLRIISAFYGVLKPRDGVTPYRLEMQAKVGIGETKNLYEYWGDLLYRSVIDNSRIIINLASKEYSCLLYTSRCV